MDTLGLHLLPHPDQSLRAVFSQIEIRVNDIRLLDLIASEEEAPTQHEFQQRVALGDTTEFVRIQPGRYMYPTIGELRHSGELSFGLAQHYFVLEPEDTDFDATVLLGCDCGEPGCWMLLINFHTRDDVITWSHFRQFHRPHWAYHLGPYAFDAKQYHNELQRMLSLEIR